MQKQYSLEGLRGILSIIVVIHHFILLFHPVTFIGSFDLTEFKRNPFSLPILVANTPLNLFMNGNWAVCMFFVLSGYVLSLKYAQTGDTEYLQQAALKRYIRLIIPVLAICLLIWLLHALGVFKNVFYPRTHENFEFGKKLFLDGSSLSQTLKIALLDVPFNYNTSILPVLWTITSEFLYSLMLFCFLLVTHRFSKRWLFFVSMCLALLYIKHNYAILFFAGSFIALNESGINNLFSGKLTRLLLLLFALFFAGIPNLQSVAKVYTMYSFTAGWPLNTEQYFRILSCILFLIYFLNTKIFQTLLSGSFFTFAGKISFSLYLLHLPVLFILGSSLLEASKGGINYFFLFAVCLATCFLLSLQVNRPYRNAIGLGIFFENNDG